MHGPTLQPCYLPVTRSDRAASGAQMQQGWHFRVWPAATINLPRTYFQSDAGGAVQTWRTFTVVALEVARPPVRPLSCRWHFGASTPQGNPFGNIGHGLRQHCHQREPVDDHHRGIGDAYDLLQSHRVVRALARPARQSAHGAVSGAALRAVGLARRRVTRLSFQAKH